MFLLCTCGESVRRKLWLNECWCFFSFVIFFWQAKSSEPAIKKRCPSCKAKLLEGWKKTLCQICIDSLVKEEASSACSDIIASVKKELDATIQAFRSSLVTPALSQATTSDPSQDSHLTPTVEAEAGPTTQKGHSPSYSGEEEEEEEEEADAPSRYKLSLEQVDSLLKAIYATLGMEEEKRELSLHDRMYEGLGEATGRTFPVHSVISETIKKEWADPERKPFFPRAHKRRFPFNDNPESLWNKVPKLDAAFSQVSRSTDLAFEDMGTLKDPMDKKADQQLKKAWQSIVGNLKPAMAMTCVSRNMEFWLNQLKTHIIADSPKQEILDSFPTLIAAVAYISDASADSIRMSARSGALTIAARRALWLKTWPGDAASKNKLCGVPFLGDQLFGPDLESILDRTADKKKSFPVKKKKQPVRRFFRPQKNQEKSNRPQEKRRNWAAQRGKGKGNVLFNPPTQANKTQ